MPSKATMRLLPKPLDPTIDVRRWGHVAEWLRSGLQNRLPRFNSGRGLQKNQTLRLDLPKYLRLQSVKGQNNDQ
jgi:hypothetical protein